MADDTFNRDEWQAIALALEGMIEDIDRVLDDAVTYNYGMDFITRAKDERREFSAVFDKVRARL